MYRKIVMKSLMLLMTLSLIFTVLSCRKSDDDPSNSPSGNTFKITVTIPNVEAMNNNATDDYVSIASAGSTENPQDSNIWKLNGVVQTGQNAIGLTADDFEGTTKTYILETTKPIVALAASFQIINFNNPITVSYKIEKNGKVEVDENFTLTQEGEARTKHYNF